MKELIRHILKEETEGRVKAIKVEVFQLIEIQMT